MLYFYILLLITIYVIFCLFSLLKIVLDQDKMMGLGLLFCLEKKKDIIYETTFLFLFF